MTAVKDYPEPEIPDRDMKGYSTMSTRAMIYFYDVNRESNKPVSKPSAIVYRHWDGYPERPGLGHDLKVFTREVMKQCEDYSGGMRFNDASYLAAKWIVFDALKNALYDEMLLIEPNQKIFPTKPLRFMSVGINNKDASDIEYRYKVYCGGEYNFKIVCQKVYNPFERNGKVIVDGRPIIIIDTTKKGKEAILGLTEN